MRFTLPIRHDGDDFWKSEDAAGMAEVEVLPLWMGMLLYGAQEAGRGLTKGAGHKYVKRIPTGNPKRPWRYIYHVGHAGGVGHDEHFVAGAAFKLAHNGKEGHFHIVSTAGDSVTIRHDETGHESTVSKKVLRSMLEQHHAEAIGSHREKLKRDLKAVAKHGTEKQRERLAEQARRSGHGDLVDGNDRASPGVRDRGRSDGASLKAKYASGDPAKLAAATPKDQRDRIADALVKDSLDALTAFVAKHPEARKWLNVEFDRLESLDRRHYYVGPEYLEAAIKATRAVDEDFAAIRQDVAGVKGAKGKGDSAPAKPTAPASDPKAVAAEAKKLDVVQSSGGGEKQPTKPTKQALVDNYRAEIAEAREHAGAHKVFKGKTGTLRPAMADGTRGAAVKAGVVGGYAVHKQPGKDYWTVSHQATGKALFHARTKAQAEHTAAVLHKKTGDLPDDADGVRRAINEVGGQDLIHRYTRGYGAQRALDISMAEDVKAKAISKVGGQGGLDGLTERQLAAVDKAVDGAKRRAGYGSQRRTALERVAGDIKDEWRRRQKLEAEKEEARAAEAKRLRGARDEAALRERESIAGQVGRVEGGGLHVVHGVAPENVRPALEDAHGPHHVATLDGSDGTFRVTSDHRVQERHSDAARDAVTNAAEGGTLHVHDPGSLPHHVRDAVAARLSEIDEGKRPRVIVTTSANTERHTEAAKRFADALKVPSRRTRNQAVADDLKRHAGPFADIEQADDGGFWVDPKDGVQASAYHKTASDAARYLSRVKAGTAPHRADVDKKDVAQLDRKLSDMGLQHARAALKETRARLGMKV